MIIYIGIFTFFTLDPSIFERNKMPTSAAERKRKSQEHMAALKAREKAEKLRLRKKKSREHAKKSSEKAENQTLKRKERDETNRIKRQQPTISEEQFLSQAMKEQVIKNFELAMKLIKHKHCTSCKMVSLTMEMSNIPNICKECHSKKCTEDYWLDNNMLPVWYDENNQVHYERPKCLKNLYDAEKMLIQRASPFIPLHHIKNGTFGIKGHVCTFPQNITDICKELPRLPSDVTIVKVVHTYQQELGDEYSKKIFKVRRKAVLEALYWLQKHNKYYSDVKINASNLNWLGENDEGILEPENQMLPETYEDLMEDSIFDGPTEKQIPKPKNSNEEVEGEYGMMVIKTPPIGNDLEKEIADVLEDAAKKGNNIDVINWPIISKDPISEYGTTNHLFSLSFPWLFPGGYGDFCDYRPENKITAQQWGKHMLFYQDGRFAFDKMFSFFL